MNNYYATSVVTKATSPTIIGHGGRQTLKNHPYSMAARQVSPVMVPMFLEETFLAFPIKIAALFILNLVRVAAVLMDLLKSKWQSPYLFICPRSVPFPLGATFFDTLSFTVHVGPMQSFLESVTPNPQADGLGYNPRCIARDISKQAANASSDEEIVSLIKNSKDVLTFQNVMQGDFANGLLGVHSGGHYTIGGDAGTDFFNSPADPAFFFHHTMIDRVWWIWQNQDIENRQNAIGGTITFLNRPPSRNGTLEDNLGFADFMEFPNITNADALNTLAGPFCYIYA